MGVTRFEQLRFVVGVLCAVPTLLWANTGWQINGSNTLRLETYDTDGDRANTPWGFDGGHYYNEVDINFLNRLSPYDTWRGQLFGVINDSEYRSTHHGVVPERLSLIRENGEAALPYRLEVGDYYGYFSYLTQQSSLKGASVDLQPLSTNPDRQHSFIFLMGENKASWRDLEPGEDSLFGASWLMSDSNIGTLGLNYVYSHRDADAAATLAERNQSVASVVWQKNFQAGDLNLGLETEGAVFRGEHNGAAAGSSRSDNGFFVELTGKHRKYPLGFRLRGEDYGQDFQPRGGVITADRRSAEAHASWRTQSGINLRGRWQTFRDGVETTDTLSTLTRGINISGPLFGRGVDANGSVDLYVQEQENESLSTDSFAKVLNANINKALPGGWSGRLGLYYQDHDDRTAGNADARTRQASMSLSHNFKLVGFRGVISPGFQYRRLDGTTERDEWNPTLALSGAKGPHQVSFNYGYLDQDSRIAGTADVSVETLKFDYRYQKGRHLFGVEAELYDRQESSALDTDAYALRLTWTMTFEMQSKRTAGARGGYSGTAVVSGDDMLGLVPGAGVNQVNLALAQEGVGNGIQLGDSLVYEHSLLDGIDQRQRLVLTYDGGSLERSALLIEFDDIGNMQSVGQTYARVRKLLVDRYGSPDRIYEKGDFTPTLVSDVNSGSLVRILEWDTDSGVMRFGIPRRLDGQVRMELQHAPSFPAFNDTLWSVRVVR